MHFPEEHFKHLVQMVKDPEMTGSRNELRGAVGQLLGKMTAKGGRERSVRFPMPQVYGGGDLGEREMPRPREPHDFVCRGPPPLRIGCSQILAEKVLQIGTVRER